MKMSILFAFLHSITFRYINYDCRAILFNTFAFQKEVLTKYCYYMKLKYMRPSVGNFGDDLGIILFNKLFGKVFSNNRYEDVDFYGIGTIITGQTGTNNPCVIFGSGVREFAPSFRKDQWDVFFLRGPVSSNILGFNGDKVITDAAYACRVVSDIIPSADTRDKISVIPHWSQMDIIDWAYVEEHSEVHVIDPRRSVNQVLNDIVGSKKIIAAAMHGAIMADVCRVPWIRLKLEVAQHETLMFNLKWHDWLYSIGMDDFCIPISTVPFLKSSNNHALITELINVLKALAKTDMGFRLSDDIVFSNKLTCISNEIDRFMNKYK
jgi:succinoglycan biosynthesis protein ExoV